MLSESIQGVAFQGRRYSPSDTYTAAVGRLLDYVRGHGSRATMESYLLWRKNRQDPVLRNERLALAAIKTHCSVLDFGVTVDKQGHCVTTLIIREPRQGSKV